MRYRLASVGSSPGVAVLAWLAFSGLGGCDGESAAGDGPCRVGDSVECACPEGERGRQVCLQDGSHGPCLCSAGPALDCEPGAVRACRCDDGRQGEAVCLAGGGTSRCQCDAMSGNETPSREEPAPDAGASGEPGPPYFAAEVCCGSLGSCVPERLIPAEAAEFLGVDRCEGQETLCVPDVLADPGGARLQPCRGPGALEGRCLPECLPDVQAQAPNLARDLCPRDFLCVPCFDPYTGAASGVCELGADPGPLEDPVIFGACCDGIGRCVPGSLVPESERAGLPLDVCDASRALVCAPETLLDPDGFTLESCRAVGDLEGRCVAQCLLAELGGPDRLTQSSCPEQHACVPCFDPFSGAASGACTLGDDPGPTEAPVIYARCCEVDGTALGSCVPAEVLPAEAAALPQDSCTSVDDRCLPDSLRASSTGGFARCSTLLGGDGGCLPECMVPSPQFLIQGVCAMGELCVPCSVQGTPTGACLSP